MNAVTPKLATSIALWRNDQVLLIQRGKPPMSGVWSLPGGHVEAGERLADAVTRELFEETGLTCSTPAFVCINEVITHDHTGELSSHYAIVVHTALYETGDPVAADDARAVCWAGLDDLTALNTTPELPRILHETLETLSSKRG